MNAHYYFRLLFLGLVSTSLFGQENQSDAQARKQGFWRELDQRQEVWAKGRYEDDERKGPWLFFLSPLARKTGEADLKGSFDQGQAQGIWEAMDWETKIKIKGELQNGLPHGLWRFYDQQGNLLAKGNFEQGLRQGQWLFYHNNQPMAQGEYLNSEKIGTWTYDYYPQNDVRVKASYDYQKGQIHQGKQEWYKVERHPKFKPEEILVGLGTFQNGLKSGKWVEYQRGLKGDLLEIGYYDGQGQRQGLWEILFNNKPYQQVAYNKGRKQGGFKTFYDNGQVQYETYFEDGLETGGYRAYHENGQLREEGGHTIIDQEQVQDTLFKRVELPIDYLFRYAFDPLCPKLNIKLINWIAQPEDLSLKGEEIEARYRHFQSYGLKNQAEILEIRRSKRQSVKVGVFRAYHENGQLRLEGQYLPSLRLEQSLGYVQKIYGKDGAWKEYDDLGFHKKTYLYQDSKLLKVLDDKGNELPR